MKKIITLAGDLGSGKSTVSKILIEKLDFEYVYTGAIQRNIAERLGMTTTELNIYSETHPEIDNEIDSIFKSLTNENNLIVDSRLAWFFLPNSFKIFLKCNTKISVDRIFSDEKRNKEIYRNKEEALFNIIERKTSEVRRYLEYYDADISDMLNFDFIIDTSFITPQDVVFFILENFKLWTENKFTKKVLISPLNLYPTKTVENINTESESDNIRVVNFNFLDYVITGHKKVKNAINNNEKLIEIEYLSNKNWKEKLEFNYLW